MPSQYIKWVYKPQLDSRTGENGFAIWISDQKCIYVGPNEETVQDLVNAHNDFMEREKQAKRL